VSKAGGIFHPLPWPFDRLTSPQLLLSSYFLRPPLFHGRETDFYPSQVVFSPMLYCPPLLNFVVPQAHQPWLGVNFPSPIHSAHLRHTPATVERCVATFPRACGLGVAPPDPCSCFPLYGGRVARASGSTKYVFSFPLFPVWLFPEGYRQNRRSDRPFFSVTSLRRSPPKCILFWYMNLERPLYAVGNPSLRFPRRATPTILPVEPLPLPYFEATPSFEIIWLPSLESCFQKMAASGRDPFWSQEPPPFPISS